jgi:hypothetical protein
MYDRTFGTDWERLDREEAIERAFALGVASWCGREHDGELERLREALSGSYDRSIVELAYEEGYALARDLDDDVEAVWDRLVDEDGSLTPVAPLPEAMPGALGRLAFLRRSDGPPESLDLPDFLRR